jgi:predicted RNA-binding Zn ribbon-like protein
METTEEQPALELGLDFSNTVDWRNGKLGKVAKDGLTDYDKLVQWSVKHGLVRKEEARRLVRIASESGKDRSTLRHALELRETIYGVFSAAAHEKKPENRDLEVLNEFISEGLAQSKIIRSGERFQWSWSRTEGVPDKMLWPIAKSAADLLTSERLEDVRECANEEEGCGWLFLDCTKNHGRIWCSTDSCGNRDKVRRFYEAHKKVSA